MTRARWRRRSAASCWVAARGRWWSPSTTCNGWDAPSARMLELSRCGGRDRAWGLGTRRVGDPRADRLPLERGVTSRPGRPDPRRPRELRPSTTSSWPGSARRCRGRCWSASRWPPTATPCSRGGRSRPARGWGSAGWPAAPVPRDVKALVARRARALPAADTGGTAGRGGAATGTVPLLAAALGRPPGADLEPAERAGISSLTVEWCASPIRCLPPRSTHPLPLSAVAGAPAVGGGGRYAEHQARHLALAVRAPTSGSPPRWSGRRSRSAGAGSPPPRPSWPSRPAS